ncbi:PREDICTED: uncharacterized protein LOC104612670 [Nelumbo nucifera]|uniref:Uncharacterized protein LOC104612670 n=1 Tax=Nelumbo nucifera TaxID=4432 RepID=A0A1U8BN49_NELNU|nr:PREDICTED: uncharacterized protein LOC104612670 [Nelumbo nucifera]
MQCSEHVFLFFSALSTATILSYLYGIETLNGSNFYDWKEQIEIVMAIFMIDFVLLEDEPPKPTDQSTKEEKDKHEDRVRANRICLMVKKWTISKNIRSGIPDETVAKKYMTRVQEQFVGSSKAIGSSLMTQLVNSKYEGAGSVREHILHMADLATQMKSIEMNVDDGFLIQFILNSLPYQLDQPNITYNAQKDKWSPSELISMCVQEEERLKKNKVDSMNIAV